MTEEVKFRKHRLLISALLSLKFRQSVHPVREEFENGGLFLQLGLPSTLTHHKNRAFWKHSAIRRNLKMLALHFNVWMEDILKTECFENNVITITM